MCSGVLWRPANITEIKHTCFLSSWKWVEIGTTKKYWATTHVSVYQQLLGDCMPFLTYLFPKGTSTTAFASFKWDNFGLCLIDTFTHEICHLASSAHMKELNRKVGRLGLLPNNYFILTNKMFPNCSKRRFIFLHQENFLWEKYLFFENFSMSKNNIINVELVIQLCYIGGGLFELLEFKLLFCTRICYSKIRLWSSWKHSFLSFSTLVVLQVQFMLVSP